MTRLKSILNNPVGLKIKWFQLTGALSGALVEDNIVKFPSFQTNLQISADLKEQSYHVLHSCHSIRIFSVPSQFYDTTVTAFFFQK